LDVELYEGVKILNTPSASFMLPDVHPKGKNTALLKKR
jgi:hypothetical protein